MRSNIEAFPIKKLDEPRFTAAIEGNFLVFRIPLGEIPRQAVKRLEVPSVETLSPRERQVLGLIWADMQNKEIADRLSISKRTVKFHVSNLLGHFKVQTRYDLRKFGIV